MARVLRQRGIPYVDQAGWRSAAAGAAPEHDQEGPLRHVRRATALHGRRGDRESSRPAKKTPIRAYLPSFRNPIRWVPDPVDVEELGPHRWQGVPSNAAQKRISFLGRFDVLCKGIDVLVEIARMLPEAQFDLYGRRTRKTRDWLARLNRSSRPTSRSTSLSSARQRARCWPAPAFTSSRRAGKGFAFRSLKPCTWACPVPSRRTNNMAGIFQPRELGLVLSADPRDAADQIREALSRPEQLQQWSQRGRDFARTHFHPAWWRRSIWRSTGSDRGPTACRQEELRRRGTGVARCRRPVGVGHAKCRRNGRARRGPLRQTARWGRSFSSWAQSRVPISGAHFTIRLHSSSRRRSRKRIGTACVRRCRASPIGKRGSSRIPACSTMLPRLLRQAA